MCGLSTEAATGFQSRRGRCREPAPVTVQYAAFETYKADAVGAGVLDSVLGGNYRDLVADRVLDLGKAVGNI